jgi:hypothetical protein
MDERANERTSDHEGRCEGGVEEHCGTRRTERGGFSDALWNATMRVVSVACRPILLDKRSTAGTVE